MKFPWRRLRRENNYDIKSAQPLCRMREIKRRLSLKESREITKRKKITEKENPRKYFQIKREMNMSCPQEMQIPSAKSGWMDFPQNCWKPLRDQFQQPHDGRSQRAWGYSI